MAEKLYWQIKKDGKVTYKLADPAEVLTRIACRNGVYYIQELDSDGFPIMRPWNE
jgi:hypothetical protein